MLLFETFDLRWIAITDITLVNNTNECISFHIDLICFLGATDT